MWSEVSATLAELVRRAGGPSKGKSGLLRVEFDIDGRTFVELGTYDIGAWPSWTELGPFNSESEALKATLEKLDEARKYLDNYEEAQDDPEGWDDEPPTGRLEASGWGNVGWN